MYAIFHCVYAFELNAVSGRYVKLMHVFVELQDVFSWNICIIPKLYPKK